jgi:hypothetical protein
VKLNRICRSLTSLTLSLLLSIQLAWGVDPNTGLNSADVAETVDKGEKSKLTEEMREKSAKSAGEFQFAHHLDGFSLWHLLFLSNYLAGSSMPLICRNAGMIVPSNPIPTLQNMLIPLIALDNLVYSFASFIQLYFDYLLYEQNKKLVENYNTELANLTGEGEEAVTTGSGTGSGSGSGLGNQNLTATQRNFGKRRVNVGIVAGSGSGSGSGSAENSNKLVGRDLDMSIRRLQLKMIEDQIALLKMKKDAVQATEAGYKLSAVFSAAGLLLQIAGAADPRYGAMFLAAGAAASVAKSTVVVTGGAVAGGAGGYVAGGAAGAILGPLAPIAMVGGSMGGTAAGAITGAYAAASIDNAINGAAAATILGFPDVCLSMAAVVGGIAGMSNWSDSMFKKHAEDLVKQGPPKPPEEVLWLKPELKLPWEKLYLIEDVHADVKEDAEGMTDLAGDVEAVFKTGENLANMGRNSELMSELSEAQSPMDAVKVLSDKFLTKEFFNEYAYYMGFRNGGENAFLAWLISSSDLIFFPGRGYSMAPVPQVPGINGSFFSRMVHSTLSAYFAFKYRQDVESYINKLYGFRDKVAKTMEVLERDSGGGAGGGNRGSSGLGSAGGPLDADEGGVCLNGGEFSPSSVGPCGKDPKAAHNPADLFQHDSFKHFLSIPDLGAATALQSLTDGISHMTKGKGRQALNSLNALGQESAALSRKLKDAISFLDNKHPDRKIAENFGNLSRMMMEDYKAAARHVGLNTQKMLQNPGSNSGFFAGFKPLDGKSGGEKTDDKASIEDLLKSLATMPTDSPTEARAVRKSSGFSTYSEDDEAQALAQKFDYDEGKKPDDIDPESQKDIFKIITIRYFKSAFPRFYKRAEE